MGYRFFVIMKEYFAYLKSVIWNIARLQEKKKKMQEALEKPKDVTKCTYIYWKNPMGLQQSPYILHFVYVISIHKMT